ncbi:MAG: DUF6029 family protein [Bacteroidota bacterium]|nr:DUF6029 family protein [Bacteroidota bacterium]
MKNIFFSLFVMLFLTGNSFGQNFLQKGQVHGNFQLDVQTYEPDSVIGITENDINGKKAGMNAFGNIIYTNGKFSAGMRYEAYLPQLNGFDNNYEGSGIANRYIKYTDDDFEITVGNFYDQFGNGLVFRSYEEWSLGYDNSMDGVHVKLKPVKGVVIKGIYGTQRYYWNEYEKGNRGIVRGVDAEIYVNDVVKGLSDSKTRIILGGSFVSKFEKDNPFATYKLPENVASYAARMNIRRGKWNLQGEYAHKTNDPNAINNNIFKDGEALWASASYSQRGFGIIASAKRIDNFSFRSARAATGNALDINFLPPLAYQHTYTLPAMYPYATQSNGEIGASVEAFYTIPRKTTLGGKYGTSFTFNYSRVDGLDKEPADGETEINEAGTEGYQSDFFAVGDVKFYEDMSIKIEKKFSKTFKGIAGFTHLNYNRDVIEENIETSTENVLKANVAFVDVTYKIDRKKALRLEMQYLASRQDSGNWALAMVEYSVAPKWFFTVQDQYNFNNPETDNTYHYYTFGMAYVKQSTRIAVAYGRQREGILCIGGVCRRVPASSGMTITITSNF